MSEPTPPPMPGEEHAVLGALVGTWVTEGDVRAGFPGRTGRVHGLDTYEWVAGGFFLLHRWDVRMPDGRTQGIEVIGHDPSRGGYVMRSFDSAGNVGEMKATVEGDAWTFEGESLRFTGGFRDAGAEFGGTWEQRAENGEWVPWMDITLRRSSP